MTDTSNKMYSEDIKDPDEYLIVSKKHWARRENIKKGSNDKLANLVGRPGPITGMVIGIIDSVVGFIVKFTISIFAITSYAFDWVNNMTFGNFKGILPSSLGKGKVISMKFFRYIMTVLMPPMGVFLNKGMYGWFNVIVCCVITYINFIAGIVYAFVITSRNRYADQYEEYMISESLKDNPQQQPEADYTAFLTTTGFICLIFVVIFVFIKIF